MHHNRKYEVVEDFFDEWSDKMAYILGFIVADGSISKDDGVRINLNYKDLEVLEFIRNNICPHKEIKFITLKPKLGYKERYQYVLNIYSKQMVKSLSKLGVIRAKTGKEIFPDMPLEMIPHFIRGVFDGDGTVFKISSGLINSSICSASKEFLVDIHNNLNNLGTVSFGGKIWQCRMGAKDSLLFRDFIYNNDCFSLKRKKDIFYTIEQDDIIDLKYTKEEDDKIIEMFKYGYSWDYIAKVMGKDRHVVSEHARKLGYYKKRGWSQEQINFIIKNYDGNTNSIDNMCEHLGRSKKAIINKIYDIGGNKIKEMRKQCSL